MRGADGGAIEALVGIGAVDGLPVQLDASPG
jgi:hypothetical protein